MPLTVATVEGYMTKPDGSVLSNGVIVFTLSGVAASDNYILNSQPVSVETDIDGFFTVDLLPNAAYEYPTSYDVTGYEYDEVTMTTRKGYSFGRIRVPEAGGDIQDMLPVPDYGNNNSVRVIKGDSIYWQCVWTDDIGFPIDLSTATIECRFVHTDGTVYNATIDDTAAAEGKFVIDADTTTYKLGQYGVRVTVTNAGITKTQTGVMRIVS